MKGKPEVIKMLNDRLAEEHTAIQQYTVHAAMCLNWGYTVLSKYMFERAEQEREHAKELIDRILFLDGEPDFSEIGEVEIGKTVEEMFELDKKSELSAIAGYTESVEIAVQFKDFGTRKLMEHIIEEEDKHLNDIESNITQIINAGIQNYLVVKIEG